MCQPTLVNIFSSAFRTTQSVMPRTDLINPASAKFKTKNKCFRGKTDGRFNFEISRQTKQPNLEMAPLLRFSHEFSRSAVSTEAMRVTNTRTKSRRIKVRILCSYPAKCWPMFTLDIKYKWVTKARTSVRLL